MSEPKTFILGAGMTGLAAGSVSGLPVFEARPDPGGICSSYYVRPGSSERLAEAPADGEAYRFEVGGGHWIFGGDPVVLRLIASLTPLERYERRSSVYLPQLDRFTPYPIQTHLRALGPETARRCLEEITALAARRPEIVTLGDWLRASFGPTLCELFFEPFHALYAAGLTDQIAPQDAYKSPVDLRHVIRGAYTVEGEAAPDVGYNATFAYPREGLDVLSRRLAARCDVRYGKRVVAVDLQRREVHFEDGAGLHYESLLSTLPLNVIQRLSGLETEARPCPGPAVLVVNLGAVRGPRCPDDQWVYVPQSGPGFHRVGFYNHVDPRFLPRSRREAKDRVSIYVEKAYPEGARPSPEETQAVTREVVEQLQAWGWIEAVEVTDPTWIDVAYTWSWPGSTWKGEALRKLEAQGVYSIGRYGRWLFQGIADSLRDGLYAGAAFRG